MPIDPVYAESAEGGGLVFGLGPDDFEKVRQGYACAHCLEEFLVGGTLVQLAKCPTCKAPVNSDALVPAPQDWLDYEKKRNEALSAPPRRP